MAELKPIKVTIDVTGFDAVKEAIARREAKIDSLQEFIRERFCGPCRLLNLSIGSCEECGINEHLQWNSD